MKSVGVITEYNPFHLGHAYQLRQMKEQTQADIIVVAMSGNVVQRGEFAILDKWKRAEIAVQSGADLVIELPLLASLQAADYFAYFGIQALSHFKVDIFAFGTETASTSQLQSYTEDVIEKEHLIDEAVPKLIAKGFSYAAASHMATQQVMSASSTDFNPSSSNHILAKQYLLQNLKLKHPMQALAIPRLDRDSMGKDLLSGSQVRSDWFHNNLSKDKVPTLTYNALQQNPTIRWEDYWDLLRYAVLSKTPSELHDTLHVREGIENRIIDQIKQAENFHQLTDALTSKRWTTSSIQRILLAILLNMNQSKWVRYAQAFEEAPFYRVLAFSQQGQAYLRLLKQDNISFQTKLKHNQTQAYFGNLRADQIYALNPRHNIREQNYQTLIHIKK
ncbi:tRNA(Met) cytidine acetate ligase [Fundicoccus culcitae]|uniref:tRNA(Met) cytidine acetate ligase n=1 Tax=Fundicoccus culcitae TaxID=2969821 RepID=A0ABY5P9X1_9LACT|nr:nucleotidyltransferase family protein [Fundicoccus culcitae]UUX35543.1 nucleotidyltransferase family protein [Fundicoccus culcitae]